jgi:hypothetical protein
MTIKLSPGAHTCNPNSSGGRDQEDLVSKPDWVNIWLKKNPSHKKKTDGLAQGVTAKKKKKEMIIKIKFTNV